ncbi:MAG: dephospho-CoA kinase [Treponema sp.]|nr:dephospho-CoA kinase [Treponema sp.]
MLIGLTGAYCAGKNHVASLLQSRGLPVLDVDKLGYTALDSEKEAVLARFGVDLLKKDGTIDRRLLGQRVFGNPVELAALEAIVHPVANRLTGEWIAAQNGKTCVINAALLHRSVVFGRLNRIILVTAPVFTRLLRARRRDRLSWAALLRRFSSQKDFNSQYLAGNAEIYKVENPGLTKSRRLRKKLEYQIDMFLEGID